MVIHTTPTAEETTSLSGLARRFLDEADGSTYAATQALQAKIASDKALRAAIASEAIMAATYAAVQKEVRQDRRSIWESAGSPQRSKTGVAALAEGIRNSLMDFPLSGGVRLRDATREEVEAQSSLYASVARDTGHKARWLALIAGRINPGQKVGSALTEADLKAAHEEATNA